MGQEDGLVSSPPSTVVDEQLPADERVLARLKYRPHFDLVYKRRTYFLTENRVIFRGRGLWKTEHRDVPLGDVISINHERKFDPALAVAAVVIGLVTILLFDVPFVLLGVTLGLLVVALERADAEKASVYTAGFAGLLFVGFLLASLDAFGYLVGGLLGVGIYHAKDYVWAEAFQIETSNPEVSIELPYAKSNPEIEEFVRSIRQGNERDVGNVRPSPVASVNRSPER